MNYERASITEIAKAAGLSRAGIVYYYPYKLDLFIAVADKFFFNAQHPDQKHRYETSSLAEFIELYINGIKETMQFITDRIGTCNNGDDSPCINFYYFHFIMQVRIYYPGAAMKYAAVNSADKTVWLEIIKKSQAKGEIRQDINALDTALLFHNTYFGQSYEESFLNGLNLDTLRNNFLFIYSLIKV